MRNYQVGLLAVGALVPAVLVLATTSARSGPDPTANPTPRDCRSPTDRDRDQDGHPVQECGGDDCDDSDAFRFPGAGRERCEGKLPDGRAAADHDEDCNPCSVSGASDGDADHDGFPSVACTNSWSEDPRGAPQGCDLHQLRIVLKSKLMQGLDCDDRNYAVVPGAQICDGESATRVCAPSGGFAVLPTSSALVKPPGVKATPAAPDIDNRTNYAAVPCPSGTTCRAQPSGTGMCR